MDLDPISQAALWGLGGAFIYAAQRWRACRAACRSTGDLKGDCNLEFAIALITGAIAAAAFSKVVLTTFKVPEENAVAAVIGLAANSPVIVKRISSLVNAALGTRLGSK